MIDCALSTLHMYVTSALEDRHNSFHSHDEQAVSVIGMENVAPSIRSMEGIDDSMIRSKSKL